MPSARFSLIFTMLLGTIAPLAQAADSITLQAGQLKALGVETLAIGQTDKASSQRLPARVQVPNEQMRIIAAPLGGMIEQLLVAPGSRVRKGQIVARLASPQGLELQRDALQADSQAGLLQQNLKRDEQLFAEGLIAESRLQASRAAAGQARVQADERRQGLAMAGIAPGKLGSSLALQSPIDGVVLEQGVQAGQRVDGAALIYRIARLTPLWLEIQAPQTMAQALREGMPVKVLEGEVTGRLIAVGRAVDPASQTVLLRAEVVQGAASLTPGQVIEAELPVVAGKGNTLPAAAVIRHDGKQWVFVQTGDNKFEARAVKLLGQGGNSVTVDGVNPGERVAVKGVSGLKAMLAGIGAE